ncbi:MAG: ABC transporter ATP-binding protein [Spirochaetaceae bacterium]|nr:MAG: ABC transporter ATP-binding protein [Spirochaetaceae bacterium]
MHAFEEKDYSKKIDLGLWRKLLGYAKAYRRHLLGISMVMVLVAVIDASFPVMTRYAVDEFIVPGDASGIGLFAVGYAALVVTQAFLIWMFISLAGAVETGVCYDLRQRGYRRLQELSLHYYDTTPTGWIMTRMTSDSERLGETISWGIVDIMWGLTSMTAFGVFMLVMDWRLALIVLSVVPPLAILSYVFQQKILKNQRIVRRTNSRITGALNEGIMGAKTTKTLVREDANLAEFQEITGDMRRYSIRTAVVQSLYVPIVLTLGSVGTGLALVFGGQGVLSGAVSFGVLVAFVSYTVQFFDPVREMARVLTEFQSAQAAAERVMDMIETEAEIVDDPEIVARFGDVFDPKRENWTRASGEVTFRDVTFTYTGGEEVLRNFNLQVDAGQSIALVGETGSGKSTIVNLLCRFYEPSSGQILVDGVDYRDRGLLQHYSNLGYVLQQPHLFSGSVRENIRYGRLDASDTEVEAAAALVGATTFIQRLENGFESEVGEGGSLLSVGEKQLVSFARAILADPVFFVFDEATSSIDTEAERLIQNAIRKILQGRTSFIIAHRLSTIREADRILVIADGEIAEDGNHETLIAQRGMYYNLYMNQFAAQEESIPVWGETTGR